MTPVLTRRSLLADISCGLGLMAGLGCLRVTIPAQETPCFIVLADRWRDASQHYLNVIRRGLDGLACQSARDGAAKATMRVLDVAAACPRDVLIKYYVLYKAVYFTSFDLDYTEKRFEAWCDEVEREADAFGIRVPPFWWRWWFHPPADVSDERVKAAADWIEVRPWEIV